MLPCNCEYGESETWYSLPSDFSLFKKWRAKRCCSCNKLIKFNDICLEFGLTRATTNELEEKIYGDEKPLAPHYQCESCGEVFFNLQSIGYCIDIENDMDEYMKDYKLIEEEK